MSGSVSCCPADSAPYLVSDYIPKGTVQTVNEVQFYEITPSEQTSKAVIIIPDWHGFAGGHTRNIADLISSLGFHVVVPRLLTPFFEGNGEGDGVPADFDLGTRGSEVFPWLLSFKWDALAPKLDVVLNHLRSSGATKIGMVGFCWGGWVVCHTALMAPDVVCGIVPHPSIQVEQGHGGNSGELVSKVKCPFLILPAGNDSEIYSEGGEIYEALKPNNVGREFCRRFPDMQHGWVSRGNTSDPIINRDKDIALELIQNFLIQFTE